MAINVTTSGPFFDGRAEDDIAHAVIEIQDQVAAQALEGLHYWMDRYFKWPTPYYETQVTLQRSGESTVVHDRGIVYGPWLAGESLRNNASPFKGYTHWVKATQEAEEQIPRLAGAVLRRHEDAWN